MHIQKTTVVILSWVVSTRAARPYLEEPDTGLDSVFGNVSHGLLPDLDSIAGLPDFQWAAQNYMSLDHYTYYRNAAGGEWSYRNNLEVFARHTLKPRRMIDVTGVANTLPTTILGTNFSAPFFISPAARAGYGHSGAEANLIQAAGKEHVLYMPSLKATLSIEEIAAAKTAGQVVFQQLYLPESGNLSSGLLKRIESSGAVAIVLTIDSPADGDRQRAYRLRGGAPEASYTKLTWDIYHDLTKRTKLPILLKGILTVEDALDAVAHGVSAIILSNHGARQLDGSPSSLEVALDIHRQAPEVFSKLEVYADGGVRYGTDVLKLLALGVKAVGLARPFMFANVYGEEGVRRAIQILKREIAADAANLGVANIHEINSSYMQLEPNGWMS